MLMYKSPITTIDRQSFDDLSIKIAELEALLSTVTEYGSVDDHKTACLISAAERLANWLQADIGALQIAYGNQHDSQATAARGDVA